MGKTPGFSDPLRLIDDRSAAFRAAIASAPSLDVRVPTCPEWTLFDLAHHLGEGRRAWAATVAAAPHATAKAAPRSDSVAPRERDTLLEWLAASVGEMLDALREAGPERGCWTWWAKSQSPTTCGAVARHQLQEIAVHAYDAQLTVGAPQPLPEEVALDGVEEFLFTVCTTTEAWPHRPAVVDYHVNDGPTWRNWLSADGSRVDRLGSQHAAADASPDRDGPDASARGTAGELVLALYGRIPLDSLELGGDRSLFDRLVDWDPER